LDRKSLGIVTPATGENYSQIGESAEEIHEAQTGHGAPNEVTGNDRPQRRPRAAKVVAVPERRPRKDDEQEPDLQKERDVDQPPNQKITLELMFALDG
jgi:hypothetical protein